MAAGADGEIEIGTEETDSADIQAGEAEEDGEDEDQFEVSYSLILSLNRVNFVLVNF